MRLPHWSFLWKIFGICIVTAPKMPLTVLLLCVQCSTGCSSWLDHMLLLCSLKVEFLCLVSPLLVAFPDIFHRLLRYVGALPPVLFPQRLSDYTGQHASSVTACISSQATKCMLRPFVLVRIQSCFLLSPVVFFLSFFFVFTISVLASIVSGFFLFASLCYFLRFLSYRLSCILLKLRQKKKTF